MNERVARIIHVIGHVAARAELALHITAGPNLADMSDGLTIELWRTRHHAAAPRATARAHLEHVISPLVAFEHV